MPILFCSEYYNLSSKFLSKYNIICDNKPLVGYKSIIADELKESLENKLRYVQLKTKKENIMVDGHSLEISSFNKFPGTTFSLWEERFSYDDVKHVVNEDEVRFVYGILLCLNNKHYYLEHSVYGIIKLDELNDSMNLSLYGMDPVLYPLVDRDKGIYAKKSLYNLDYKIQAKYSPEIILTGELEYLLNTLKLNMPVIKENPLPRPKPIRSVYDYRDYSNPVFSGGYKTLKKHWNNIPSRLHQPTQSFLNKKKKVKLPPIGQ